MVLPRNQTVMTMAQHMRIVDREIKAMKQLIKSLADLRGVNFSDADIDGLALYWERICNQDVNPDNEYLTDTIVPIVYNPLIHYDK